MLSQGKGRPTECNVLVAPIFKRLNVSTEADRSYHAQVGTYTLLAINHTVVLTHLLLTEYRYDKS
jgi:hypothetical protein